MNAIRSMLRSIALVVAVAILGVATAVPALAKDVIHLKDGRVLEGAIVRELPSGAVFFKVGPGELFFAPADIDRIERGEPEIDPLAAAEDAPIPDGATRIAFVSLEEEVGPFFNKDAIEHSIGILDDLPDEEKPEIVVFVVDSGGGAGLELRKIVPYIHEEVATKYRTVAWIRSAISAAAMTAWVFPETYMMPQGNIGGCVGFSMEGGSAKAVEGEVLEQMLLMMEQVSVWGNKDPYVMRAMQVSTTLSATRNPDGTITWYLDDSGETLVSPKSEILTFSAYDAVRWGVAEAVVNSKEELAKALGCAEWVEVGKDADEYQVEFRENVSQAQVKLEEHYVKLNIALDAANSAPTQKERNRNIGEAKRHLDQMRSWVRKAPSLKVYMNLTDEWFREMERKLRELGAHS